MYSRQRAFALYLFVIAAVLGGLLWPAQMTARSPQEAQAATPQLFFPVVYNQFQGNTRNSTISIQNLGATAASVQVTFYNEAGQAITPNPLTLIGVNGPVQNPFTLPRGVGQSFRMDQQSLQSGQRYAVVVSSDQPLAGTAQAKFLPGVGNTVLTGMYEGFTAAGLSTTAIVPVVKKQVNNLGAELTIQNVSASAAQNVVIHVYNQAGQQAFQTNLPPIPAYAPFQTNFIDILQLPAGFEGSAVIVSPNPVAVVNHQLGEGAGGAPMRTSTSWPAGATTLYAPFLGRAELGLSAALTVMNPGNQPANVTVTLSNGNPTQATIPPLASQTFTFQPSQLAATVTSQQPVVAVVVNTSGDGSDASAYDAVTTGATLWAFPYFATSYNVNNVDTYDSRFVLYNPGPNGAPLQIVAPPRFQGDQPFQQNLNLAPGQVIFLNGLNGLASNSLRSLVVALQPGSPEQTFFGMVYTLNPSQGGDDLSAYHGLTLPKPSATMKKTASGVYLKGGDAITYTLSFSAGTDGGSAVITDDLPDQLTDYAYTASAGLVLTQTAGADFVWDAYVPASGGVITITGVVTSPVDVGLSNTASIATSSGSAADTVVSVLDVTPPNTEITGKPPLVDNNPTPTFSFMGDDSNAQGTGSGVIAFECKVDSGDFAPCTSPFTTESLSDGEHTFQVRAIDRVGHVDPTPASYTWTIDTTAPAVPTLTAPANASAITTTNVVTLTWDAVADGDLAGYKVKLNGQVQDVGNTTQAVVGPLANSVYTWTVAAYDAAGNTSAFASDRTFTVDYVQRLVIDPTETSSATFAGSSGFTSTVTVPAGAIPLSGQVALTYEVIPASELPNPPSGDGLLLGFSMNLFQNGVMQPGFVFSIPITIEIAYDSALVSDPSSLQLYYLDANNQWSNDGITIITPIGNPLVATLAHLTDFGLAESSRRIYLPVISN